MTQMMMTYHFKKHTSFDSTGKASAIAFFEQEMQCSLSAFVCIIHV